MAEALFGVGKAAGPTGPTFDGGNNYHTQGDAQGDVHKRSKFRGTQGNPDKRHNANARSTVCSGCGQPRASIWWMPLLFPERAPRGYVPCPKLRAYAEVRLETDTTLAEEVTRLKVKERKRVHFQKQGKEKPQYTPKVSSESE